MAASLALQPSILDIDNTTSHIAKLLAAQTNDQERYALAEKIIIDLINKNKEQRDLLEDKKKILKEQTDLLKTRDNERKELLNERQELLENNNNLIATSTEQLGKIQALDKQLEVVEGHHRPIYNK